MSGSEVRDPGHARPGAPSASLHRRGWLRSRFVWPLVIGVAVAVATGLVISRPADEPGSVDGPVATPSIPVDVDGDDDGLRDRVELAGWVTEDGARYRTDPRKADTDGDGLSDRDEAGLFVSRTASSDVYAGYSNPLRADTDGDALGDADEADASTEPADRDTDRDKLSDYRELQTVGSSPVVADTDRDGLTDGYEVRKAATKGLDPLWVDVKVSGRSYATDFLIGSVAGDAWRKDSLAWLLGNLGSGGVSLIPVVGWIVGPAVDVRDAVAAAILGDWVSSGFSVLGVVPYAGDAVAIPAKATRFVSRNPELAVPVSAAIVAMPKVSQKIKLVSVRAVQPGSEELLDAGASKRGILRLAKGKTNLNSLSASMQRPGHVRGVRAGFFADGVAGEAFLEKDLRRQSKQVATQVTVHTRDCVAVCNRLARIFDVVADGVAHESKVGFKSLTPDMKRQIESDAWLIKHGDVHAAHWHFFPSATTNKLGASGPLLDDLERNGITFTIHPPRRG